MDYTREIDKTIVLTNQTKLHDEVVRICYILTNIRAKTASCLVPIVQRGLSDCEETTQQEQSAHKRTSIQGGRRSAYTI